MESIACPDPHLLADLAWETLPAALADQLREHLADCELCRAAVAEADPYLRSSPGSRFRSLPDRWKVPAYAAAACVLLALGGIALRGGGDPSPGRPSLPPAADGFPYRKIRGIDDLIIADASQERRIELPDGTRLRIQPGTRVRFYSPGSGERCRLQMEEGELAADVAKGDGAFVIAAPAGEARVLGTRLHARAFAMRPAPGPAVLCLSVEVSEGKVQVRNAAGETLVRSGQRGIALGGREPIQQGQGGARREVLEGFSRLLEPRGSEAAVRPGHEDDALCLAAAYWGISGSPEPEGDPAALRLLRRWRGEDR